MRHRNGGRRNGTTWHRRRSERGGGGRSRRLCSRRSAGCWPGRTAASMVARIRSHPIRLGHPPVKSIAGSMSTTRPMRAWGWRGHRTPVQPERRAAQVPVERVVVAQAGTTLRPIVRTRASRVDGTMKMEGRCASDRGSATSATRCVARQRFCLGFEARNALARPRLAPCFRAVSRYEM